jgi:nucleoside-diphosphate-sugar epimerase
MRVLVTGHNGYIGCAMVDVLRSAGHLIIGLDTYFFAGCGNGNDDPGIPAIRKDIRDLTPSDLSGVDAVVHLAALCNDPLGDLNPEWTSDINYHASHRLAALAKEAGVTRFLYASSCSMYGKAGEEMVDENAPLRPLTPYAISKVRAEEAIGKLADENFSPVFMRNATAYGMSARLRADVVLNNLVCWAHTTGKIRVMSDGTPWRPIVHIRDIARAFAAALAAPRQVVHNEAFNVGANDENYQVLELAEIVRETVPGCVVEYAPGGGPDPRSYRVSFDKFRRAFPQFKPEWDARRGAGEVYDAVREAGLTPEDFQGRSFVRLKQLKHLLDLNLLDHTLRWRESRQPASING